MLVKRAATDFGCGIFGHSFLVVSVLLSVVGGRLNRLEKAI
jgi:hypothetical protein